MHFQTLMDLRQYLTIKHHVPGRIRIKFGLKLLADPRAQTLKEETENQTSPPCIKSTKLNMLTRNVIIEYDPEAVDPQKLHEALITEDEGRFNELAAELEKIMAV